MNVGDVVAGTIGAVAEVDEFTFTANAGAVVTVALAATAGFAGDGAVASLFSPSGIEVGTLAAGTSPEFTLTETGQHVIEVHAGGTTDLRLVDTGSYALAVEGVTPASGSALTLGTTVTGDIAGAAEIDSYTFSGNAGEVVTVVLGEVSGFNPDNLYAELFAPSGAAYPNPFTTSSEPEFTLAETGTHTLQILAFALTGTGDYAFSVEGVSPPSGDAVAMNVGDVVAGTIAAVAEVDEFTFTANAGDGVTVALAETAGFIGDGAVASLFSPSGAEVGTVAGGGASQFTLTETGGYVIEVLAGETAGVRRVDTGSYSLSLLPTLQGPMVFTSQADGANNEIWTRSADGQSLTQLTFTPADSSNADPEWSPDGSQIVFFAFRDGATADHVFVMDANGSNQQALTNGALQNVYPSWSPDGSEIVFARGTGAARDIWKMDSDGGNQTELTVNGFEESQPSWSPDGSTIVYYSAAGGNWQLFTMNSDDGTNQTNISNNGANDFQPQWSPDGSQIVFVSDRDGNFEIYVMDADGSNQTRLSNDVAADTQPSWTPDGTHIVFATDRDGGDQEIYMMDTNGSNLVRVTNIAGPDQFPSITAN
jgi:tricorn protease-like protein